MILLPPVQWLLALVAAMIVVGIAVRLRSLSMSGAIAAILLGTTIVGTGGWWAGIILLTFFSTSSILSRLSHSGESQARGSQRDWVQVLANGWGLLAGSILFAISGWYPWLAFGIGAVAAATADTWSSEIGKTNPNPPKLITTGKIVSPGTSGAVSWRGTIASLAGAVTIGAVAALAASTSDHVGVSPLTVLFGITLAGIAGGFVDSILGATLQEQRWCATCEKATEANPHRCGASTAHLRGIERFNNDVVNMLCVLTGALIGMVWSIL